MPLQEESSKESASEEVDDIWEKYPQDANTVSAFGVDKEDILWRRCSFDKAHSYATNYLFNGYHLLKKHKTDVIVALLWKVPVTHDTAYHLQNTFDDKHK